MELKDDDAARRDDGSVESSLCYRVAMALLYPFIFSVVTFYVAVAILEFAWASETINGIINQDDHPISADVQLVGVKGLDHPATAPGAVSPAFDLLLRVDNGRYCDQYREGGGVTVSYAGVPLAHGRTPSFRVGAKAALTFAVNATGDGSVGVPEDLFRLMTAERRWSAAQVEVGVQLGWPGWESYAWSIDLDG